MTTTKVLVLSLKDLTGPGYVGRYHHLVEQLAKEFDVYLFNSTQPWKQRDHDSPDWDASEYTVKIESGYPLPIADSYLNEVINAPFNIRTVRKIISKHEIDVVINGSHLLLGVTTPLWQQSQPVLFDLADYFPTHGNQTQASRVPERIQLLFSDFIEFLQNTSFKFSDTVSVNTALLGEKVTEEVPSTNVKLFSNAVDSELFQPKDSNVRESENIGDKQLFGFGGTINSSVFDFEGLFKGFRDIKSELPDAKLMIIGDGPDKHSVELAADSLDLSEHVIFTGSVPYYDLPEYYSAFDIGIIPHHDRMSNHIARDLKLFEYLACGTPALLSPIEEVQQFVFPPEEDHEFLEYVKFPSEFSTIAPEFIIEAKKQSVKNAARQSIIGTYDWGITGQQLREYIKTNLLSSK